MANIYDVAAKAGVSFKTVSRVANNEPGVAESTRLRVVQAMEELNYSPNIMARGLVVGRRYSLGLIIPDIASAAHSLMVEGVEDTALGRGYDLVLCSTRGDTAREETLAHRLAGSRRVDGLIILSDRLDTGLFEYLDGEGLPFVVVGREVSHIGIPQVFPDNVAGTRAATEHLLALGHTRLAYISCPLVKSTGMERMDGFNQALNANPGCTARRVVVDDPDHVAIGYRAAMGLLSEGDPPTAICTFNDLMALGVLRAFNESGVRVPGDVALVGFDDIQAAEFTSPPLTTVHQRLREMGTTAAGLLLDLLDGVKPGETKVRLPVHLVVRESCGFRASQAKEVG